MPIMFSQLHDKLTVELSITNIFCDLSFNGLHRLFAEVKDLIQKCLSVKPQDRPTISEVLCHSWIQLNSVSNHSLVTDSQRSDCRSLDSSSSGGSRESI